MYHRDWGNVTTEVIELEDSSITEELWSGKKRTVICLVGSFNLVEFNSDDLH